MSSKLIRRIAARAGAVGLPCGAAASSAPAADWSAAPQANVVTADSVTFAPIAPCRSSWS